MPSKGKCLSASISKNVSKDLNPFRSPNNSFLKGMLTSLINTRNAINPLS
jgi:hypothetical protein